jgi:signal transduction histidine kinase
MIEMHASCVSHDMRSPLITMEYMVEAILKNHRVSRKIAHLLQPIRCASKILSMQVYNLLDYNLLEKEKFTLRPQKLNIKELIQNTVDAMKPQAEMRSVEIMVDVFLEVPRTIIIDPDRFQQILLNLISNAIKFTRDGTITVKCFEIS